MNAEAIARGLDLRRIGRTWRGACPIHGGTSFTLAEKSGKPVFTCWSGCDRAAILAELKRRGLWPKSNLTVIQKRAFAQERRRDEADMQDARLFADATVILAEQCLEEMDPSDPERGSLTRLIAALRTEVRTLAEFRAWRTRCPKITAGLVEAGREHAERWQVMLSHFVIHEVARAS